MTHYPVNPQPLHHLSPRTREKNGFLSRLPESDLAYLRTRLVRMDRQAQPA